MDSVEKKTSAKGTKYYVAKLVSGAKSINLFIFLPDGSRAYDPSSSNSIALENFLNFTVNAGIRSDKDNYAEALIAGINLFDTPQVFAGKELKIQVGYKGPHIEYVKKGEFRLVNKQGEPLLGIEETYPTRDAAYAAFEAINAKRPEPLKLQSWPDVLKLIAPDTPNKTLKITKKDVNLDEEADDDLGESEGF